MDGEHIGIFGYVDEAVARNISSNTVQPTFVASILIMRPDGSFSEPVAHIILPREFMVNYYRPLVTH